MIKPELGISTLKKKGTLQNAIKVTINIMKCVVAKDYPGDGLKFEPRFHPGWEGGECPPLLLQQERGVHVTYNVTTSLLCQNVFKGCCEQE